KTDRLPHAGEKTSRCAKKPRFTSTGIRASVVILPRTTSRPAPFHRLKNRGRRSVTYSGRCVVAQAFVPVWFWGLKLVKPHRHECLCHKTTTTGRAHRIRDRICEMVYLVIQASLPSRMDR